MDIRKQGIVIRTTDVGETDRLVTLLTPDEGLLTLRAKGCRSAKSKLRYATQPMCFGHFLLAPSKVGYILTGCDSVDSFASIGADLTKFYVASVVLDAAAHLAREGQGDATLFVTVLQALKEVAYHQNPLHVGVVFLLQALSVSGHGLRFVCHCGEVGHWVDLASCGFCCDAHRPPLAMPVSDELLSYLASPDDPADPATMHEAYVILARCMWHTVGVKLMSVQELCKQWDVLAAE